MDNATVPSGDLSLITSSDLMEDRKDVAIRINARRRILLMLIGSKLLLSPL